MVFARMYPPGAIGDVLMPTEPPDFLRRLVRPRDGFWRCPQCKRVYLVAADKPDKCPHCGRMEQR